MDKANEIFSCDQSCQFIIDYVRFRDHLCPHIQGQILIVRPEMVSGTSINFNLLTWLKTREDFINSLWLIPLQPLYHCSASVASFSTSSPQKSDQWPCCSFAHSADGASCQIYDNIIISRKNFNTSFSQIKRIH
jgi:hypothetical protein